MRRSLCVLTLLLATYAGHAQEPAFREDLRFAEALRSRGDSDLALEYLQRLAKTAPPELAKELPLEFAKTRLRVASEEPESGKRLILYKEARDDFQKFIAANPGHPRLVEANLDIARILNLQGKTELNNAFLAEDAKAKRDRAAQARSTLMQAAGQLLAAEKELKAQLAKLPDPEAIEDAAAKKQATAARSRVETEIKQTQLERGLNLYDQADTYFGGMNDEVASNLLVQAKAVLDPLRNSDARDPLRWKASAWIGRILFRTESAQVARDRFLEVLNAAGSPAAEDGVRLARYFRLLVIQEQPSDADRKSGVASIILDGCTRWRNDYRRYLKTPEGTGVTFLNAQTLLGEAETNKKLTPIQAGIYRRDARALLRELEASENEFTDRARRLKIETMLKQGLLKGDIKLLGTFEDCFVRAQFEIMQLNQSQKDAKDPAEAEKLRQKHVDNIFAALNRGLSLPEAKKMKASVELNTARSMLAYWALTTGKLKEAIAAGEAFARDDPRSSQAEMAAVYALQGYTQLMGQKQAKNEDVAEDRKQMLALAAYMEERWPKGIAGDAARHAVGLALLREDKLPEAVAKLGQVNSTYTNYTLVCFQLADACGKAEKATQEPVAGESADDAAKRKAQAEQYRARRLQALESMPESSLGSDPFTNQVYLSGKAMLGRDWFRLKRFQPMDDLATGLLGKLLELRFNDDEDKDRAIRNQLRYELMDVKLYARYGLADGAFQANDHAKVLALLDPLVDAAAKEDETQERVNLQKNQQLGMALLTLALRSNIQLGKIDRTDRVLDVMDKVSGEGGELGVVRNLAGLIRGQIEELKKKGDKEALDKATRGYSAILDKRVARQKGVTPEFARVLAACYSSMDEHPKAVAELDKVLDPKAKPGSDEEKLQRRIQLDLIRELRLSKEADTLKRARKMLDEILGAPKKPNWGRKDLAALKEQGHLLAAEEKFTESFDQWKELSTRLSKEATKGAVQKENYLEASYHMIASYVRLGMAKKGKAERDKFLKTAALQIVSLEKSWEDFGSEASKKRFTELLGQEAALREQYEAVKKK